MANIKYLNEVGLRRVSEYVNAKLTFASSMPESPEEGTLVLYIGADTEDFSQGGVYLFDGTDWILINLVRTIELTQAEYGALPETVKMNGAIYFVTDAPSEGSIVEGYRKTEDGKFYQEATFENEIAGSDQVLYIDLLTNTTYRYDNEFIRVGGGAAIKYVAILPSSNIEDVVYGIKGYNSFEETIAEGFLDSNELFEKTGNTYAPIAGVTLEASEDGTSYAEFSSLAYDGTGWTLTYADDTMVTLADGDIFYFRQPVTRFYAGDATNQEVVPFSSSGGGSGVTYTAGEGINIENDEISVTEDRPATFTGTKAQWNALSIEEKAQYTIVNITDDPVGGEMVVVDTIENGNLNPVTSNAVFDALKFKPTQQTRSISGSGTITFSLPYRQLTIIFIGSWSGLSLGLYLVWPDVVNTVKEITANDRVSSITYDWTTKNLTITVTSSVTASVWQCEL